MMGRAVLTVLGAAAAIALAGTSSGTSSALKIAYVTDVAASTGRHDLRGVALLGFQRAVRAFHIGGRIFQADPRQGTGPRLELAARQKYALVILGEVQSYDDIRALVRVARKFPLTKFFMSDPPFRSQWPANVERSVWRVEQPAYLAGFLAALEEKQRPGKDVVASVGGFRIPSVDTFMIGFEAGARKADPGITTLRTYSNDFLNAARCRSAALAVVSRGAAALFNVAGACGLGTLQVAKQKHVWGVGVDVDQSFLGPQVLTSVVKHFDVQIHDTVDALVHGRLRTGGTAVWDLENGAVGLGKISPRVPKDFLRKLDLIRAQIVAGKIKVP